MFNWGYLYNEMFSLSVPMRDFCYIFESIWSSGGFLSLWLFNFLVLQSHLDIVLIDCGYFTW